MKLETWQAVCRVVGIEEGQTITACKAVVQEYVSACLELSADSPSRRISKRYIATYTTSWRHASATRQFPTARTLAEYSIDPDKIFPLRSVKEHPFLRWMLIRVLHTRL